MKFTVWRKIMDKKFIMTAFGKDRPGIVADVSQIIYENGCNLEDSTMTLLADEFTIMLLFAGKETGNLETSLLSDCRRLEKEKGITAYLKPVSGEKAKPSKAVSLHTIHVEGPDQAGIVFKVSRYLADNKVNIVNLTSRILQAPESGMAIYTMDITVEVPQDLSIDRVDSGLDRVRDELLLDIAIS
jgi:glycine cleavage system transcriptional repressor